MGHESNYNNIHYVDINKNTHLRTTFHLLVVFQLY